MRGEGRASEIMSPVTLPRKSCPAGGAAGGGPMSLTRCCGELMSVGLSASTLLCFGGCAALAGGGLSVSVKLTETLPWGALPASSRNSSLISALSTRSPRRLEARRPTDRPPARGHPKPAIASTASARAWKHGVTPVPAQSSPSLHPPSAMLRHGDAERAAEGHCRGKVVLGGPI